MDRCGSRPLLRLLSLPVFLAPDDLTTSWFFPLPFCSVPFSNFSLLLHILRSQHFKFDPTLHTTFAAKQLGGSMHRDLPFPRRRLGAAAPRGLGLSMCPVSNVGWVGGFLFPFVTLQLLLRLRCGQGPRGVRCRGGECDGWFAVDCAPPQVIVPSGLFSRPIT